MINEDSVYQAFGKAIAGRRKALGMTQAQLASAVGLDRTSIAHIERGSQRVFLHHVLLLSEALELHSAHEIVPTRLIRKYVEPARVKIIGAKDLSGHQRELVMSIFGSTAPKKEVKF